LRSISAWIRRRRLLAPQLDRHAQACERRTRLVARIGERRLLRRQQRLDVRRGGVEGAGDDRDLVVAAIPVLLSVNEIVKSVGGSLGDRDMEIWILEFLDRLDAARA
jgi:hypothetical protein